MSIEEWRAIAGWEGYYSVSSLGRIRSEARVVVYVTGKSQTVRERILSPAVKKSGHLSVQLYRGKKGKRMHVHRAVQFAFGPPQPSPLHDVAHNDSVPANNLPSNLRWATCSENFADKVANGTHNRGERHPLCKISDETVRQVRAASGLCKDIGAKFNIHPGYVWAIRARLTRNFVL